jgi:hypothetical protein
VRNARFYLKKLIFLWFLKIGLGELNAVAWCCGCFVCSLNASCCANVLGHSGNREQTIYFLLLVAQCWWSSTSRNMNHLGSPKPICLCAVTSLRRQQFTIKSTLFQVCRQFRKQYAGHEGRKLILGFLQSSSKGVAFLARWEPKSELFSSLVSCKATFKIVDHTAP